MTEETAKPGETRETGFRLTYPHCAGCGAAHPHSAGYGPRHTGCCALPICNGIVGTFWQPQSATSLGRGAWACCRGLAERCTGEPHWLPPLPPG